MKKATKLKAKQFKWATDQMKPGVIYSLYLGEEIIPVSKDKRKMQKKTYLKISHKTGARFIAKAFICNNCGHLFFVRRMKNNICCDCQVLERQRKSRNRTKANYTTKANRKKKKKVVKKKTAHDIAFEIVGEYPRIVGVDHILEKSFDEIYDEIEEGMI